MQLTTQSMLTGRTPHVWNATIQGDNGQVIEREVRAHWDPAKVGLDEIAAAAATEATMESKKSVRFAGIGAELVA
jgi:hypothetical protein